MNSLSVLTTAACVTYVAYNSLIYVKEDEIALTEGKAFRFIKVKDSSGNVGYGINSTYQRKTLSNGLHIKNPLDDVAVLSTKYRSADGEVIIGNNIRIEYDIDFNIDESSPFFTSGIKKLEKRNGISEDEANNDYVQHLIRKAFHEEDKGIRPLSVLQDDVCKRAHEKGIHIHDIRLREIPFKKGDKLKL